MNGLRQILDRFKNKCVVVFGDLVADVFVYGEISRISREAPVLVLNHRETQVVPEGAQTLSTTSGRSGLNHSPSGLSARIRRDNSCSDISLISESISVE